MPNPHSSVAYAEPNFVFSGLTAAANDGNTYDRAPNLEDYCIYLDIEVELSSREDALRTNDPQDNVIIMSYRSGNRGEDGEDRVSFMSGSKIAGRSEPNILTSRYADMFITDLVDYGTTEMLGIKSVDVEYNSACVPIITIKFTDVRGMSLFQPTELNNNKSYNAIRGFSKDNIAQSFFHAFFVLPLPKFTIHLKGFYGKPVSYEVMCDKFDAAFNSATGNFDVTTRFIGFAYSFMSDISFDALLAAPYSDYVGAKYWKDNIENKRFTLPDKTGEGSCNMPTLYEIRSFFKTLTNESDEFMQDTTLTAEEKGHSMEIGELNKLRDTFRKWYEELYEITSKKYGKDLVYLYGGETEDDDYRRLVILTNGKNISGNNLSDEFAQYSEEFKQTNSDLYNKIESFNESDESYAKLANVSTDFSNYTKKMVFNELWYNSNTRKIVFDGFSNNNVLPREETIDAIFTRKKENEYDISKEKDQAYWDEKLGIIYNDGVSQYIDAFVVEQDYSSITRRIRALIEDANKTTDEAERDRRLKEHNRYMFQKMGWYPSIENTTKIVMAHLETLMAMMFDVVEHTTERTADSLKISIGKDGNLCDVNSSVKVIPPFPRATKLVTDEDGITKREDVWVGDFNAGEGFREVDIVNGLFNGISKIKEIEDAIEATLKEQERASNEEENGVNPIISYPLSPLDFFIDKNPYGSDTDISNDKDAFAGKICMRMFSLLAINSLRNEYGNDWLNMIGNIATAEAENFYKFVKITNVKLTQELGNGGAISDGDSIVSIVTNTEDHPWNPNGNNDRMLFNKSKGFWLERYKIKGEKRNSFIYPIQDMSFEGLDESLSIFQSGKMDYANDGISVSSVEKPIYDAYVAELLADNGKDIFKTAYIGKYNTIFAELLNNALSDSTDSNKSAVAYKVIAEKMLASSQLKANDSDYKALFNYTNGFVSSFNGKLTSNGYYGEAEIKELLRDSPYLYAENGEDIELYVSSHDSLSDYFTSDIVSDTVNSGTITEVFGVKIVVQDNKEYYQIDKNKCLFLTDIYYNLTGWTLRNFSFTKADVQSAFFVMCMDCFSYEGNSLSQNKTFCNIPNLLALQIGAVLAAHTCSDSIALPFNPDTFKLIRRKIPVSHLFETRMSVFLNTLSPFARIRFIKHFLTWSRAYKLNNHLVFKVKKTNRGYIVDRENVPYKPAKKGIYCAYFKDDENGIERALLNQDSEIVKSITNSVMLPVMFVRGTVNALQSSDGETPLTRDKFKLDETQVKTYLNAFLERLRELLGVPPVETGNVTTLAKDASQTNKDMKIELYRYLKQIFDKWIPTTSKNDWKYETFFEDGIQDGDKEADGGHIFHFIDSYYNKVGSKLLINPQRLAESIKITADYTDVNIMMYNFLADLYGGHRCMMKCIQNFRDLSKGMNDMFEPVPYTKMGRPKRFSDFVVIYTYAPSKNLNVANGEFNDDGFMLNDELETPLAIRSRGNSDADSVEGGTYYKLPAFGVSYGRQYQSYFKNVNVNMSKPVMTQQAIAAKHSILRASRNEQKKIVTAQDLYDVYANQSYTCNVEMMGCAWVQPLMYFVLLNIPMFRGSYLIMKVTHHITPGDMTTTITGCRMANVSNRMIEDIFTDETNENNGQGFVGSNERYSNADVTNDCPYKVFPVSEDVSTAGGELSGDENNKAFQLMKKLMAKGFNKVAAAGIVGNMRHEVDADFDYTKMPANGGKDSDGYFAAGLCQWNDHYGNLTKLLTKTLTNYGKADKKGNIKRVASTMGVANIKQTLADYRVDYQIDFIVNTIGQVTINSKSSTLYSIEKINACATPEEAAESFRAAYERGSNPKKRKEHARKYYDSYHEPSEPEPQPTQANNGDTHDTKNFGELFFNAVQKSAWSSPSSSVKLTKDIDGNTVVIKQEDGKGNKLGNVFDIILNGYYDYVQQLYWVYSNSWGEEPLQIAVVVAEKVNVAQRGIYMGKFKDGNSINYKFEKKDTPKGQVNDKFLASIAKRYDDVVNSKIMVKEAPQFSNLTEEDKKEMFKEHLPTDCTTMCNNSVQGAGVNSSWAKSVEEMGKWFEANIHTYSQSTWTLCPLIGVKIRRDCSGYVAACLKRFGVKTSVFKAAEAPGSSQYVSGKALSDTLTSAGFKKLPYNNPQPFDIIAKDGHVEIYAGNKTSWGWGSCHDGRGGRPGMPAPMNKGPYTVIWRYVG